MKGKNMLTHWENDLLRLFARIRFDGVGTIGHRELLQFYGAARYTVSLWRDFHTRWKEAAIDAGHEANINVPLLVGDTGGSKWSFIWANGIVATKDSRFKSVDDLATKRAAVDSTAPSMHA
ncbi:MAG TPA: hypothetical protein VGH47_00730 [Xanthobacteraceae bacterium]|jgi:hypothetical protein